MVQDWPNEIKNAVKKINKRRKFVVGNMDAYLSRAAFT
jgi:hypothetical protein